MTDIVGSTRAVRASVGAPTAEPEQEAWLPGHAWELSSAPVDAVATGSVSRGFALRLAGDSAMAQCGKDVSSITGSRPKAFTIEARLRVDGAVGAVRHDGVLLSGGAALRVGIMATGEVVWLAAGLTAKRRRPLAVGTGGGAAGPPAPSVISGPLAGAVRTNAFLPPGPDWHHLALIYDGRAATVSILVDGLRASHQEVEGSFSPSSQDGPIDIGGVRGEQSSSFRGVLDDVAIWNPARSYSELTCVDVGAMRTAEDLPADLAALWRMDEGTGDMLVDATTGGTDCAIVGQGVDWEVSTAPTTGEGRMCTAEGVRCAAAFAYKDKTYYGCTSVDSRKGRPWCYTDESRGAWDYCLGPCTLFVDHGLAGPFTQGAHRGSGMGAGLGVVAFVLAMVLAASTALLCAIRLVGGVRGRGPRCTAFKGK